MNEHRQLISWHAVWRLSLPKAFRLCLTLSVACLFAQRVTACEPILPLGRLLMGPNFFAQSLLWLAIAVSVKAGAFILLERTLRWHQALLFMLLANVVTSLVGVVVWAAVASSALTLFALPFVYLLSIAPSRRVIQFSSSERMRRMNPFALAACFPVALVATIVLFYCAESVLVDRNYVAYWSLKFLFVTLSLGVGIGLTTLWEEWIVARCARKLAPAQAFFASVGRANYITFGLVLLGAAFTMLPQRLHSPGFIAG